MASNAMIIGETDFAGAGESQPRIWPRQHTGLSAFANGRQNLPYVHQAKWQKNGPLADKPVSGDAMCEVDIRSERLQTLQDPNKALREVEQHPNSKCLYPTSMRWRQTSN